MKNPADAGFGRYYSPCAKASLTSLLSRDSKSPISAIEITANAKLKMPTNKNPIPAAGIHSVRIRKNRTVKKYSRQPETTRIAKRGKFGEDIFFINSLDTSSTDMYHITFHLAVKARAGPRVPLATYMHYSL